MFTGNETTQLITLSGSSANVAQIIGDAALVIDGVTLTITGGSALSILSNVDVVGGGAIAVTGAVTIGTGDVRLGETNGEPSAGFMTISAATVLSGTIREIGAGNGSLTVSPAGSLTVTAFNTLSVQTAFLNAGTVTVDGGQIDGAGSLTQTGGLTTVAAGGVLDKNVNLQGGVLRGDGTVASIQNSGGTVEPGASPGTLSVTGAFVQGAGATLRAEIAGTSAYDRLSVAGAATLDGTLAIVTAAAFTPPLTSTFGIVTAASRSGQFASITGTVKGTRRYKPTYHAAGLTLCVADIARTTCGPDTKPPQTTLTAGPRGSTRAKTATFRFKSSETGSTFKCKLDKGPWTTCRSPKTYRSLRKGAHTFQVRAKDKAGNVDATPAKRSWRVTS